VNNIVYASFEEAVRQLGLLDEDDEFDKCLEEAVTHRMAPQLRQLFATILLYSDLTRSETKDLFTKHRSNLNEDYIRRDDDM